MINIILVSHGGYASGMLEAAEMILGKQEYVSVFGLYPGESGIMFRDKLEKAIDEIGDYENILVLSDMPLGTPANMANVMALKKGVSSVTGTNLPLLLDVLSLREDESIEKVIEMACEAGQSGITNAGALLKKGVQK